MAEDTITESLIEYIIKFKYGLNVHGVLPGKFTNKDIAQDQCDHENKMHNNVDHWVEEVGVSRQ